MGEDYSEDKYWVIYQIIKKSQLFEFRNRRDFLRKTAGEGAGLTLASLAWTSSKAQPSDTSKESSKIIKSPEDHARQSLGINKPGT